MKSGNAKPELGPVPSKNTFHLLITGEEFSRRKKIESLLGELVPVGAQNTNLIHLHSDDLDLSSLITQASTPSLLGGAQVFWISEIDRLKKLDWAPFEDYCAKPERTSYFVFEARELPKTHPLLALVKRLGQHIHFDEEAQEEIGKQALKEKLKRAGKTLTPSAWNVLEEKLSGSLVLMDRALDQLILYSEGAAVDEAQVEKAVGEFLQYDPFDLTNALLRQEHAKALAIFHSFYELSGDLTSTVGLIHWQLKRLWRSGTMLEEGVRPDEIARVLRISPFRITAFLIKPSVLI